MKKWLIIGFFAVILAGSVFTSERGPVQAAASEGSTFSDTAGHWAEADILAAVQKGYVDGYPEGTFQPDKTVARSEFIAMMIRSLGQTLDTSVTSPWYTPYVKAATKAGFYVAGDFSSNDWNAPLSRLELAKIAVRAIGKSAKEDTEFMYVATANGVLSGTGNGELDVTGTTTRAQTVTVIERISRILLGETLPTDKLAVANAEKAMNTPKDQWGRVIRTTNLPKNAKNYPYILEKYPNEMYEMGVPFHDAIMPAQLYLTNIYVQHKPTMDSWKQNAEDYYKLLLNVDYRTINESWATELFSHMNNWNRFQITEIKEYVAWVKKNKVVTEGTLEVEPSMVFSSSITGCYYMRTEFSFVIKDYSEYKDIFYDEKFNAHEKLQKGHLYYGFVDIGLSTTVQGGVRKVSNASLFNEQSIIHKKN
ncbi:S-layer homology domain-containing protein [Paenibacillus monticola]|uniref:SLH domain-containing protein n=1 Tax=Paenibacillus monticola TaxID=2666075 RepID=A0A7X2H2D9_9BACL|nr:S-layer homology domain-containing protein [Paenibacillus monticola]MRN52271.1 hypothetical protein [Paenibacillus monticola]